MARTAAPKGETIEQKTARVGALRISNALKAIKSVGNLGSDTYSMTEEMTAKAMKALRAELDQVELILQGKADQGPDLFSF